MLKEIKVMKLNLKLLSGMSIGGADTGFDIGGADNTVIRNPITNEPYIPGSSFKGKLKSLLKYRYGEIGDDGRDIVLEDNIKKLFEPADDSDIKVTRALFRDRYLTEQSKKEMSAKLGSGVYTEVKAENSINVLSGKAANPRFTERVPAGAEFAGEILINVFDGDDADEMESIIEEALKLLELNYIGSSGSRGYGRVEISSEGFVKAEI